MSTAPTAAAGEAGTAAECASKQTMTGSAALPVAHHCSEGLARACTCRLKVGQGLLAVPRTSRAHRAEGRKHVGRRRWRLVWVEACTERGGSLHVPLTSKCLLWSWQGAALPAQFAAGALLPPPPAARRRRRRRRRPTLPPATAHCPTGTCPHLVAARAGVVPRWTRRAGPGACRRPERAVPTEPPAWRCSDLFLGVSARRRESEGGSGRCKGVSRCPSDAGGSEGRRLSNCFAPRVFTRSFRAPRAPCAKQRLTPLFGLPRGGAMPLLRKARPVSASPAAKQGRGAARGERPGVEALRCPPRSSAVAPAPSPAPWKQASDGAGAAAQPRSPPKARTGSAAAAAGRPARGEGRGRAPSPAPAQAQQQQQQQQAAQQQLADDYGVVSGQRGCSWWRGLRRALGLMGAGIPCNPGLHATHHHSLSAPLFDTAPHPPRSRCARWRARPISCS